MDNKTLLIQSINKTCAPHFGVSTFYLHPKSANRFSISGSNTSKAINSYKNYREEINVINWFEEFWVYVDIEFQEKNTFISVSIFQGEPSVINKKQLLRAEWDDYNNDEEFHPQPHWHILNSEIIDESSFESFARNDHENGFAALLEESNSRTINIDKMHFAMNASWTENQGNVLKINDIEKVSNWFNGLFSHLKVELQYIRKRL